jgi:hypothetical protein
MKSFVRFLFAAVLCLSICQSNIQAQGLKGAFNKVKGAVNSAVSSAVSSTEAPSEGPAKPLAPDVKNSVSQIRSYTGLTKDAFTAKIKGLGFVEGIDDMGMGGTVYKSKKAGYTLSVNFGTRGGEMVVRDITKGLMSKKPSIATLKTNFLDYAKQCADLKTKFTEGFIRPNDRKSANKASVRNLESRESKFLPALNSFVSANEDGSVYESYTEKDYDYSISLMYSKAGSMSMLMVRVIDKTIDSGGEV